MKAQENGGLMTVSLKCQRQAYLSGQYIGKILPMKDVVDELRDR